MSDDRLTPEEQAVIEAASEWFFEVDKQRATGELPNLNPLHDAVAAYRKATAPPEPFEGFVGYDVDGNQIWVDDLSHTAYEAARVWRCTVTPTERVR